MNTATAESTDSTASTVSTVPVQASETPVRVVVVIGSNRDLPRDRGARPQGLFLQSADKRARFPPTQLPGRGSCFARV
jgi:hypothetical protein